MRAPFRNSKENVMKKITGFGNWRLQYVITEEREEAGPGEGHRAGEVTSEVTIVRAVTCDRHAVLPEALPVGLSESAGQKDGRAPMSPMLPVVKIAGHALSADPWDTSDVAGVQEIEITDGTPPAEEDQWSNRQMLSLRLPEGIREVGDYAFLNCRSMQRIELADREISWQRACFMNCRALQQVVLRRQRMELDGTNMAFFVGETTGEMEVVVQAGREEARLVFPDYLELYTENNEARQFDYTIEGAGYPYRHVFRDKRLSWHDYDGLWKAYLGRETDLARAARMAWYRVSRPVELTAEHRESYLEYVKDHFSELAEHLLEGGSMEAGAGIDAAGSGELALLVRLAAPDASLLAAAAETARRLGRTDCLAVLMEEEHKQAPAPSGRRKTYEL